MRPVTGRLRTQHHGSPTAEITAGGSGGGLESEGRPVDVGILRKVSRYHSKLPVAIGQALMRDFRMQEKRLSCREPRGDQIISARPDTTAARGWT
ncbi:hypothetical protein BO70DRAFT_357271 [Aspergillus heteromorphus CBS 117.55]|uniref:Uncharacterized protein n=1 Tax=Aspergillus heteromorphus CBS 117.55 TaxID=1448321 RepID=A0A317X3P6_9EURO|nr:uncharacterized protein BO70DRAFT_357271 [Aspergillus heteromorphus CBS 117.55]PWY92127.1 hypothetical protein BO70DRAFT_357271 [Aspergillus heteromorphus CBS 117.55]